MKKYLAIIIFALISLSSNINSYAVTFPGLILQSDNNEVRIGDTITITASAKCKDGLESIEATIDYDRTKLEFLENDIEINENFIDLSEKDETTGEYKITALRNVQNELTESELVKLKFKVLDNVQSGEELNVKLSNIRIEDSEEIWTNLGTKSAKLRVFSYIENNSSIERNQTSDNETQNNKLGMIIGGIILAIAIIICIVAHKKRRK